MENTSIAQDLAILRNRAMIMDSLVASLKEQSTEQGGVLLSARMKKDLASIISIWAELQQSMETMSEDFDYLSDLSKENNLNELFFALKQGQ